MTRRTYTRLFRLAALTAVAGGLAGCVDYTVENTVNPDGTGVRVEHMEIGRNSGFDLSEADFRVLTGVTESRGWTSSLKVDRSDDTTWVVDRRSDMRRLEAWSQPAERVVFHGTTPDKADERIGYVRLGDVKFRSSIQVAVSRRSDGTSLVTYRESFLWDQAADAIVEFLLKDLGATLAARYPRLTEAERGAILGFARARIWVAGDEGLFFGENENEAIARAAERTAEQAVKIVRVRYPAAESEPLRQIVSDLLNSKGDQLVTLLEEWLPGVNLGINTDMVVRVTLPGTVITTNAAERDGNTLEWSFGPMENITSPVEIFAEAVVGG